MTEINGRITNRDLYSAIDKLESKIIHRFERLEDQVDINTKWINKATGQFAFLGIGVVTIITTAINFVWDKIIKR